MLKAGAMPENSVDRIWFLVSQLLNPWILSSLVSAFLALITWMVAMTKLELSHAYPFMSLAFVLVLFFSHAVFNEMLTAPKLVGVLFIVIGMAIGSQG
jgi:drug/metabolite transporter (DMT)-like permease